MLQVPDYSQNHNRYSYALNNPLKFTDPSGESIDWMENGMPYNYASRYDRIALQHQNGTLQTSDWYAYGGKQYNTAQQADQARGRDYLNYFGSKGIYVNSSFATGYVNRSNDDDFLVDAKDVGFSGFKGGFQDAADLFELNTDKVYNSIIREALANFNPSGIKNAALTNAGIFDPIDLITGGIDYQVENA